MTQFFRYILLVLLIIVLLSTVLIAMSHTTRYTRICVLSGYAGYLDILNGDMYCYLVEGDRLVTISVSALEDEE